MAEPQIIIPGQGKEYVPLMINGDRTNYGLDHENCIPVDSVVFCGLPKEFKIELTHPYDPEKRTLVNNETKISVLEMALKHFAGRGMDFLLADPLTCQTIVMGKDSGEESMEYVSRAFVKAAPMVKRA